MSNSNRIILGIFGAAVAGVAIGMLLAPEKGGDVRKKIGDTVSDFICRVGDMLTAGKEKLQDAGNDAMNQGKNWADDVLDQAKEKSMA